MTGRVPAGRCLPAPVISRAEGAVDERDPGQVQDKLLWLVRQDLPQPPR